MAPQCMAAPQRAQLRLEVSLPKLLQRFAHESELPGDPRAAVADGEVNSQADPLDEAEAAVEALRGEARRLLACKQFHFANQFISRHLRNAMRAR